MALSYDTLDNEAAWRDEYEPPALAAHNTRLRAHYSLSKSDCGSKGDNRHLKGRHRSYRWCTTSAYCTNRSYGTTAARDKRGDPNALRATDVGLTGQRLRDATARLLAAKRAGRLAGLAEFFGTVDGVNVVGWFEGHEATSDDSHLYHLHNGYWGDAVNDPAFLAELFDTITGADMPLINDPDGIALIYRVDAILGNKPTAEFTLPAVGKKLAEKRSERNEVHGVLEALMHGQAALDLRMQTLEAKPVTVAMSAEDRAAIVADLVAALHVPTAAEIAVATVDEDHRRSES